VYYVLLFFWTLEIKLYIKVTILKLERVNLFPCYAEWIQRQCVL
jgi:hypothetical protein